MSEIEAERDAAWFAAIREAVPRRPESDPVGVTISSPSEGPIETSADTLLVVEVDAGIRTGRWLAFDLVQLADDPTRKGLAWPPVASNWMPNSASRRMGRTADVGAGVRGGGEGEHEPEA